MNRILLLAVVAGCASAPHDGPCPEVRAHWYEVPRIPHPGYIPDGVLITRLDGESAWTRAGLLVNDVVESVNGQWTLDEGAFRKAALERPPRSVRIVGSRAGPVGRYRLVAIELS